MASELIRYSWSDKTNAATKYMSLGNMRLVSELTEIPYPTLLDWKKSDWWSDLVTEIKKAQKAKTNNKLTTIIEDSLPVIADRIENGDWVLNNKTGEMVRRPVALRDVANVTNQLLTRQLQLEELSERMEHRTETVQETLQMLAKEFSKWQRIQNKTLAEDIEYAVHDQRETGLQEGSGEVHEQASGEEETGGTERSETNDGESGFSPQGGW